MTLRTITAATYDTSGEPDNTEWVFASELRGADGEIITTRPKTVKPVAGQLTVQLQPGPTIVQYGGRKLTILVPDEDADLWDLIEAAIAYPPNTAQDRLNAAVGQYVETNREQFRTRAVPVDPDDPDTLYQWVDANGDAVGDPVALADIVNVGWGMVDWGGTGASPAADARAAIGAALDPGTTFYVREHGLVGDWSGGDADTGTGTDDTAALNALIAAAPEGSIIAFDADKTYRFDHITITKQLVLDFNGAIIVTRTYNPGDITHGLPAILFQSPTGTARAIASAPIGSSTITLSNAAHATDFATGRYVIIEDSYNTLWWQDESTVYNDSGFGEMNRVLSVDGGTGVLTLETPTMHPYTDTMTVKVVTDPIVRPEIRNVGRLIDTDPGVASVNSLESPVAPHVFYFDGCVEPKATNITVEGWMGQVVGFNRCPRYYAADITGRDPFFTVASHGYVTRARHSQDGLVERIVGVRNRHTVDYAGAVRCTSKNCTSFGTVIGAYETHGLGSRDIVSIDDAVIGGNVGWAHGNPPGNADHGFTIIRPRYDGTSYPVVVSSKSTGCRVIAPMFKTTASGVVVRAGSDDTTVDLTGGEIEIRGNDAASWAVHAEVYPAATDKPKNLTIIGGGGKLTGTRALIKTEMDPDDGILTLDGIDPSIVTATSVERIQSSAASSVPVAKAKAPQITNDIAQIGADNKISALPFPTIWTDIFAINAKATPTYETSSDGSSWSGGSRNDYMFLGEGLASPSAINLTQGYYRWTWGGSMGNTALAGADNWLMLGIPYATATTPQVQVTVESSPDGTTWTTRNTSTFTAQGCWQALAVPNWGADGRLRVTVRVVNSTTLDLSAMRMMVSRPDAARTASKVLRHTGARGVGIGTTSEPSGAKVRIGDNNTTAAGGVQFGSDTSFYRDGSNSLRTGGALTVDGQLNVGTGAYNAGHPVFGNHLWVDGGGHLRTKASTPASAYDGTELGVAAAKALADLIGWTFDPAMINSGTALSAAAVLYVARIPLHEPATITNIVLGLQALGDTLTHAYVTLHKSDGTLLGQSADQSTAWETGGSTGLKTIALGSPAAVTPIAGNDFVWAGIYVGTATTRPAFFRGLAGQAGILNAGTSAARSRFASYNIADTATIPYITPGSLSAASNSFWMAVS